MTLAQAATRLSVIAALAGAIAWYVSGPGPMHHPPGVLVAGDPEQFEITGESKSIEKKGWNLKLLARYTIQARVLGIERYPGEFATELSPADLALGWGRMSDEAVLERIVISQSARNYHWQYWGAAPLSERDIMTHSANVHIIPADSTIAKKALSLRLGELVRLDGYLVEATHPRADRPWRSSLVRDDEGEGACELMLVQSLNTLPARR